VKVRLLAFLIGGAVSGEVPDCQAAAFLMAAVIRGLSTAGWRSSSLRAALKPATL
jgi:thymidine phosphorylase